MGDGGSLLLDKAQRMLVTSSGSFMCCNTCLFVCLSICLISNVMPKVCCPCLPKQMNFRKFFQTDGEKFVLWDGGGTMVNDVEIRKSSRVTMQAFCECGFVQTYCNNRSLHLNIYTFKHGLKTFFIQIL